MSIKTKLLLILTSFAVVPVVLFGVLVFSDAERSIAAVRIAQLNTVADLKKDKIETFFRERESGIRSAQSFYNIKVNLPKLGKLLREGTDGSQSQAFIDLDRQIKGFQRSYGYLNVILTDTAGKVVYASNVAGNVPAEKILHSVDYFDKAKKGIYFTDIFRNASRGNRLEMIGAAPLLDFAGRFIGEIVIEIDMAPIYRFIADTTGLGQTGEALIARKEADVAVFLSPLRSDPDAALKRKASFHANVAFPAQKAVQGENGSGTVMDYGGVEVLAAWRYVPLLRWGLVTKIQAKEAFAPIAHLRIVVASAALVIVVLAACAALWIAKAMTGPILSLQRDAEAIAAGNLDHQVGVYAKDEIGLLARAFNTMTAALKEKITLLEASNKELEAFSYSVSHDLRSPLRGIDGFSHALLEDYADKLDAEGKDYLDRVRAATQRMGRLIDDLLKLSRVSRAGMNRERIDLSALVRKIAGRLADSHPGRQASFVLAENVIVFGDGPLLTIMLENLLGNAWKFTEKREKTVIEFGVERQGDGTKYFIRDNGAGFDMAYQDKLFRPFHRLHQTEDYPGTGIGLATVKRVIERHGGSVWIEGRTGEGATVYFTLP